jgi:hypothetical protein
VWHQSRLASQFNERFNAASFSPKLVYSSIVRNPIIATGVTPFIEFAANTGRLTRHALRGTRVQGIYNAAKQRCENPKNASYKYYGARGIKFLWPDVETFFADMGHPPRGASLERIWTDGHYQSGNCRWATPRQQANNRRDNCKLTAFGRTQTVNQWARELDMRRTTIVDRLARGMSHEAALSVPVRRYIATRRGAASNIKHDTKKGLYPVTE